MMRNQLILAAATLALATPLTAQEAALAEQGAALYTDFCATCHGAGATGDGPMASVLMVPVPDLTRIAERAGGFDHFAVVSKIDGRDPLVSHGAAMPTWGPVFEGVEAAFVRTEAGQPIVTSEPIAALVAWLESVQVQ